MFCLFLYVVIVNLFQIRECVGIDYKLIPHLIELTQARIIYLSIQNGNTAENSKY